MAEKQETKEDSQSRNEFKGTLIHGQTKYEIKLSNSAKATIGDLSDLAYNLTQVPISRQRLICKGKSLTNFEKTLDECSLQNGAKILLIGKNSDPEEEKFILSLSKIEKKIEQTEQNMKEIYKEFASLKQGFLDSSKSKESFKGLEKRIEMMEHELMNQIETLDSIEIESSFQDARKKRKSLVQKIQKFQDHLDNVNNAQKEYSADKFSCK